MHIITIGLVTFFLRSVGRFSGSETPQEIVDLGLTFRRKLRKRDYLLVIFWRFFCFGKMHIIAFSVSPRIFGGSKLTLKSEILEAN